VPVSQSVAGRVVALPVRSSRLNSWIKDRVYSGQAWFGALLALAFVARLYHFTSPPDDAHEWRQTQTLMYAASYGHGAGLLTPYGNWNGMPPKIDVLEFPIYSILVHWLSGLIDLLIAARALSIVFGVAAILVFDRLCAQMGHPRRRTATVLFALAPLTVFYAHATQPESLVLLMMVASAYFAVRGQTSWRWSVAALASIAVAAVIKPTVLIILAPPVLYLAWSRKQWARHLVVLAGAGIAILAWGTFVRGVLLSEDPLWYHVNTDPDWLWGSVSLRYSLDFYVVLAVRLLVAILPPFAALFIVVAVWRRAGDPFWWWMAAGCLASYLVFAKLNAVHFYYQLPMVPALAALAAYGAPRLPKRLAVRFVLVELLAVAVLFGCAGLYNEQPVYSTAGAAIAAVSSRNQPIIVISKFGADPWWPSVLYYADSNGWNLPHGTDSSRIASLPGATPCWLVNVRDEPRAAMVPNGWVVTRLTSDYLIAHNDACGTP